MAPRPLEMGMSPGLSAGVAQVNAADVELQVRGHDGAAPQLQSGRPEKHAGAAAPADAPARFPRSVVSLSTARLLQLLLLLLLSADLPTAARRHHC